jgi:hypothetical protein
MRTLKDKINEKEAYKYRKTADNAYLKIREAVNDIRVKLIPED